MKHAYLIIAHNEFEVLKRLINALDDERNDIYVHIDAKVRIMPQLHCERSRLYILKKRINVRWGDVSQIKSEYALWEEAYPHGPYSYYHLISGTHLPLKSQDVIHHYYDAKQGNSIISPMYTNEYEIDLKIRRYNLFTYTYNSSNKIIKTLSQFLWRVSGFVQKRLDIRRYKKEQFYKASNWVSLTHEAIGYMLSSKREIIAKYKYSWCGDEFFVPSELSRSPLKDDIIYADDILKVCFVGSTPRILTDKDLEMLIQSDSLFARKFSEKNLSITEQLIHSINECPPKI